MSATSSSGRHTTRRVASLVLGLAVAAGLAFVPTSPAQAGICTGPVGSIGCTQPGTNPKPLPKPPAPTWLVSYKVWSNHIKIYKNGALVRNVPVAGNPYLSPHLPSTCHIAQKLRVNWDKTGSGGANSRSSSSASTVA